MTLLFSLLRQFCQHTALLMMGVLVGCVCFGFLDALTYFLSRFADMAAFGFVSTALYVCLIAILVCMLIGAEQMS